jgi:hypothetical protein
MQGRFARASQLRIMAGDIGTVLSVYPGKEAITINICTHLHKKHGITIKEQDLVIKKVTKQRLKGLF